MLLASIVLLVVNGFIEVVKRLFNVNKRFLPAIAVVVGAVIGALAIFLDADLITRIWAGIVAGMSSVGLFELSKNAKGDE